jgi:hypothetical protein
MVGRASEYRYDHGVTVRWNDWTHVQAVQFDGESTAQPDKTTGQITIEQVTSIRITVPISIPLASGDGTMCGQSPH